MRLARLLRRPVVWAPISLALLVFVAWRSRAWEVGDRLTAVDPAPIVAALLIIPSVPVLWALRSAILLRGAGSRVPVPPLIPMTAFANTINNLTPGSSGEVFRLWLLRAHHGVPYAAGGAIILVERVGALALLTGSAVLFWLAWAGDLPPAVVAALLVALLVAPALAYATGIRPLRLVTALPGARVVGVERWMRIAAWVGRVDTTIADVVTHPGRLVGFAVTTGAILAANTAQLLLVGRAVGVDVDPVAAWGALGIGVTAGVLSLLPFGLGSTDLVVATLLGVAGVPPAEAAAMTFGYRLVSTLPLGLLGVASYAVLSARLPDGREAWAAARQAFGDPEADPAVTDPEADSARADIARADAARVESAGAETAAPGTGSASGTRR